MLIHFGPDHLNPDWEGSVVCMGTFDGVHLGHQALIKRAVNLAREKSLPSVVLTFDRHPAEVLAPEHAPRPINTLNQNLTAIESLGASATLILKFDRHLADCPAEQFYQTILKNKLRAVSTVIGHDFGFGHNRQGTPKWLKERIETHVLEPVQLGNTRISSSLIRAAIANGDCELASQYLGRAPIIEGVVVKGQQLGRKLGFPTANIAQSTQLCALPFGVYACQAITPYGLFSAATSIGIRPTVGGKYPTIESFLLDYSGESLYGQNISLQVFARLRDEQKFETLEELKTQMSNDVQQTRKVLL